MRRRSLLHAGAAALALPAVGRVRARSSGGRDQAADADYTPLGSVELPGAAEAVVGDDARYVYVATGDGFAVVNVATPTAPTVVARRSNLAADRDGGPLASILDVTVDGDRLLVPGPAQQGQLRGFLLFDVSTPTEPVQVGEFVPTDHRIHNATLVDGYAYLQAGGEMHVVDVREPPFETASFWSPLDAGPEWRDVAGQSRVLHDLWVQDGTAYLAHWDAGVFVVDVSDPADPAFVSRFGDYTADELAGWSRSRVTRDYLEPRGNAHYVTVNDDASLLGVGGESWDSQPDDGRGGPSGIDLYDVTDPTQPERLSTIHPPGSPSNAYGSGLWTTSHNFELRGDRLYSSWYQGGVMVHDVSDPESPERLAWWRNPANAFWTARVAVPGEFFVASSYQTPTATAERLFTFPDRAGEQPDPPADITEPPETTSAPVETTTESPATTTEREATPTTTDASDADAPVPGFGPLAALGGLGVAVARRLLRGGDGRSG